MGSHPVREFDLGGGFLFSLGSAFVREAAVPPGDPELGYGAGAQEEMIEDRYPEGVPEVFLIQDREFSRSADAFPTSCSLLQIIVISFEICNYGSSMWLIPGLILAEGVFRDSCTGFNVYPPPDVAVRGPHP